MDQQKPVWLELTVIIMSVGMGLFVGSAVGALAGSLAYSGEGDYLQRLGGEVSEDLRWPLLITQGVTSLLGLFLLPAMARRSFMGRSFGHLFQRPVPARVWIILPVCILSFLVADSVIVEWNMHLHLPDSSFARWAREQEDRLAEFTRLFTHFRSGSDFLAVFAVVAVIAAVAEEFLFRGLLQPAFQRGTGNGHVAVWVTAAIFSAIHMQFFGFVPRLLLGALFGYLFWWSGHLAVPVVAHLLNNGISLLLLYANRKDLTTVDLENESVPWPLALAAALLTGIFLVYLFRLFRSHRPSPSASVL